MMDMSPSLQQPLSKSALHFTWPGREEAISQTLILRHLCTDQGRSLTQLRLGSATPWFYLTCVRHTGET